MTQHLIIQHGGKTLYAGEGNIAQWEERLFVATSEKPNGESYFLVEISDINKAYPISTFYVHRIHSDGYKIQARKEVDINLDDKTKGLLLKLLGGEKK